MGKEMLEGTKGLHDGRTLGELNPAVAVLRAVHVGAIGLYYCVAPRTLEHFLTTDPQKRDEIVNDRIARMQIRFDAFALKHGLRTYSSTE